jgi:hypothetical protein
MLVIALVGCGFWGFELRRLSLYCTHKAQIHRYYENSYRHIQATFRRSAGDQDVVVEQYAAWAAYRRALAAKYERAARYPWLRVEPYPPEP